MLYSLNKTKKMLKYTRITNNKKKQEKYDWFTRQYTDIEYYQHRLVCKICGATRSYPRAFINHMYKHDINIASSLKTLHFLTRTTEEKLNVDNLGERIKQQASLTRAYYEEEPEI